MAAGPQSGSPRGGTGGANAAYERAAGAPKALWTIPEAHRAGGLEARPAEYERRVVAFLAALLGRRL